jgi:RHS repeat-associated protein
MYDANDERVSKSASDGAGLQSHTLYVFDSLEIRGAGSAGGEFDRNAQTEIPYLFVDGVRLARVVFEQPLDGEPRVGGAALHVFFEFGDNLGSTSVVIDKATGELVERSTYQPFGAAESDYRPDRWKGFREDYRFTGKEEDIEVGLQYFGKRFYVPALMRWASGDPLAVHSPGSADLNLYAYVSGKAFAAKDAVGLDDDAECVAKSDFDYTDKATLGDFADQLSLSEDFEAQDSRGEQIRDELATGARRNEFDELDDFQTTHRGKPFDFIRFDTPPPKPPPEYDFTQLPLINRRAGYNGAGNAVHGAHPEFTSQVLRDLQVQLAMGWALKAGGGALRSMFPRYASWGGEAEIGRFMGQGFTRAEAVKLAAPYVRPGHHYLRQSIMNRWGSLAGIPRIMRLVRDSRFNLLKPRNISVGRFYELHFKVDRSFFGTSGWNGQTLMLDKYGLAGRLWFGAPAPLKLTVGIGAAAAGGGAYMRR